MRFLVGDRRLPADRSELFEDGLALEQRGLNGDACLLSRDKNLLGAGLVWCNMRNWMTLTTTCCVFLIKSNTVWRCQYWHCSEILLFSFSANTKGLRGNLCCLKLQVEERKAMFVHVLRDVCLPESVITWQDQLINADVDGERIRLKEWFVTRRIFVLLFDHCFSHLFRMQREWLFWSTRYLCYLSPVDGLRTFDSLSLLTWRGRDMISNRYRAAVFYCVLFISNLNVLQYYDCYSERVVANDWEDDKEKVNVAFIQVRRSIVDLTVRRIGKYFYEPGWPWSARDRAEGREGEKS